MKILDLLMCGSVFLLMSCGPVEDESEKVRPEKDLRIAGRVERVDKDSRYVLIRRYGPWRFDAAEDRAESRGAGRGASLLPTGERLGEHVAADIRSGEVEVGDAVYVRKAGVSQRPEASPEESRPSQIDTAKDLSSRL